MLHDRALLHDGDVVAGLVAGLRHHRQIVRDEEHRQAVAAAKRPQQRQDLGLNGYVQGGGRFVRNEQARSVDDGHGDEDALALAAGELVRIIARAAFRLGQRNLAHGVDHQRADGGAGEPRLMRADSFGDLLADPHHRVERGHRFLEDHRNIAAAAAAHGVLGQRQQVDRIRRVPHIWILRCGFSAGPNPPIHPRLRRKQPQQRQRGDGLARPGLAHQAKRLAGGDFKRDAVDRLAAAEGDGKIQDPQDGCGASGRSWGIAHAVDGSG